MEPDKLNVGMKYRVSGPPSRYTLTRPGSIVNFIRLTDNNEAYCKVVNIPNEKLYCVYKGEFVIIRCEDLE